MIIMLFVLSGCSTKYGVTFDSNPQGALLVCGAKNWGHTPVTLYYDESVKKLATINVSGCSANWVSGAIRSYPNYLKVYPQSGTVITVNRPIGFDGYAIDAGYALQLRHTEAAERAAKAQESAAESAAAAAYEAQRQNNKTTTCTTNFGITRCR